MNKNIYVLINLIVLLFYLYIGCQNDYQLCDIDICIYRVVMVDCKSYNYISKINIFN